MSIPKSRDPIILNAIKNPEVLARVWSKVRMTGWCWEWIGAKTDGYGTIGINYSRVRAHRFMYILANGPINSNLTIDHLCRNRGCVNPDHLESVSLGVNILRGNGHCAINARKTHCKRGHVFSGRNLMLVPGGRKCRACHNNKVKMWYRRRRAITYSSRL